MPPVSPDALDLGREGRWQLLQAPSGAFADPRGLPPDEGWRTLTALTTVAAAAQAWPAQAQPCGADADRSDWWYRGRFEQGAPTDAAVLELDGLATIAQVWLNGRLVLESRSMYLAHRVPVHQVLQDGANELVICCRSVAVELDRRRPRPAWRVPMLEQQQLRWLRTTLIGRTPGWSPPFPVIGPWRGIRLRRDDEARIEVRGLRSRLESDKGVVELDCVGRGVIDGVSLVLSRGQRRWETPLARSGEGGWQGRLEVEAPDRWWPHTHGEPARYEARLEFRSAGGLRALELKPVGFRTIRVVTASDAWRVFVNDCEVFCRGACWMPPDPVGWRPATGAVEATIRLAAQAGMNMLRVPGVAVYEDEEFFDACDAHGVLVWHDLMFANMDYPWGDPQFDSEVEAELAQCFARWQARPSLAVVCGNSEGAQQAAMWGAARQAWSPALFHEVLPQRVAARLPDVVYWPSSAWGGAMPHQPDAGTSSYYGVGAYLRPLEDARRSGVRFASECLAFSNIPRPSAIARMPGGASLRVTHPQWRSRAPRDLTAGWDFEDVRDFYMASLYGVDPLKLRYDDHARYLALGRATSGEVMSAAFTEWRRKGSACGGALIWFLRDLWAGAGWGVLDDAGDPKACWHALRRVLQPLAVLLTDEGSSGLVAHLVNEKALPFEGSIDLESWRGDRRVHQASRALALPARSATAMPLAAMLDHFVDLNHAYRFGPRTHDVVVATLRDTHGEVLGEAHHFPGGMSLPRESDLGIDATWRDAGDGAVEVTLVSHRFAQSVHFESPGYLPDDEFFHLVPGRVRQVRFRPHGTPKPWWGSVLALNAEGAAAIRKSA
jgi:beta-mannosidase